MERDNTSKTRERDAVGDAPPTLQTGPWPYSAPAPGPRRPGPEGGEQGGAANLLDTNHATETYPDILKSKEPGDGDETKKMTDTAPNTTDLNNVNYR